MKPIQNYLENLAADLGAERLTLLLFSGTGAHRSSLLLHAGDGEPIPEVADVQAAQHLINGALASSKVDSFASTASGCELLFIPRASSDREGDLTERRAHPVGEPGYWLGVRNGEQAPTRTRARNELIGSQVRLAAALFSGESQRNDPETGLPDRGEFERTLAGIIERTASDADKGNSAGFSALLVQPRLLDTDSARTLLPAIAATLTEMLRDSDQLYRHGATALALPLPGVDPVALKGLCHKLAAGLAASPWPGIEPAPQWHLVGLHCSAEHAASSRNIDIAQSLESALRHCQISAGSRIELRNFEPGAVEHASAPVDGLFTGAPVRDYRNMGLLWRMVELIGESANASALMIDAVDLIGTALDCPVALFELRAEQTLRIASNGNLPSQPTAIERLVRSAATDGTCRDSIAGAQCLACPGNDEHSDPLVLIIDDSAAAFETQDELLLAALVVQLQRAVSRLKLTAQEVGLREHESRRLRQQLAASGAQIAGGNPIFVSQVMQRLLQQADSWSSTDETILITGESGAGKEIMAARVHQASPRADAPFVTVDCAAIPSTLLEAELFGRVKGAYTGADSASVGYARKAEGGTLFLDEIGELPIDVQAKLLRFVQEKQVSPVGSSDSHRVDVRIIAATNRDLSAEVRAGRFRGDLMYRLKVLELRLPPLRERADDIVPLASYFLDSYNEQYQRSCALTPQAEERLRSYGWPGNVRELKHSILKACLECSDELILPGDIGFTEAVPGAAEQPAAAGIAPAGHAGPDDRALVDAAPVSAGSAPSLDELWQLLDAQLESTCRSAIDSALRLPLGSWISDTLVDAANDAAGGVSKHAAMLVGLPESTYRRQLDRVRQARQCGMQISHPLFDPLVVPLRTLLSATVEQRPQRHPNDPDGNLIEAVRRRLLERVATALPEQCGYASALMGVTPPTYRRHLKVLQAQETTVGGTTATS
ncbi:MAG: sigma-54 dependent transcriptional regulator [Pseudomonadota bacterium]